MPTYEVNFEITFKGWAKKSIEAANRDELDDILYDLSRYPTEKMTEEALEETDVDEVKVLSAEIEEYSIYQELDDDMRSEAM